MPTTSSHRYAIPSSFEVDTLLPPTACFARPHSALGLRLAEAEAVAFPEAPDLFAADRTTVMLGMMVDGEIRHVMRLSVPALEAGASMPFLLRDLASSGQGITEKELIGYYASREIPLANAVSVESNVRVGDKDEAIPSADLAYLAVFEVMRRVGAGAVFAHLNDAARASFVRVDLRGQAVADREALRTPGAEAGSFDDRYRPVCLPADDHNVAVMEALAAVTPAVIWSPAAPPWWTDPSATSSPLSPSVANLPIGPSVVPARGSTPDVDLTLEKPQEMARTDTEPRTVLAPARVGLHITIRLAQGHGPTHLAAFDAALRGAAVADRNLIRLSSIIPPGATVERTPDTDFCPGQWGDRLYVVMAEERVERPHEEAWAGIAWRQDPETGEGLFVEHHGHSRNQVETDLLSTLEALTVGRPHRDWGEPELAVVGVVCEDEPVCALAVACFQDEPWRPGDVVDLRGT